MMIDRFRILVTGSRTWTQTSLIHDVLENFDMLHGPRLTIVHGACNRGADAITDAWCQENAVSVERHPADWSIGRQAGFMRNAAMVDTKPQACVAFIRNHSNGASHCANLAKRAGIPTIIYWR